MISYYFIVIAHVMNMSYVGFAAHCFKENYTNFSALVQRFNPIRHGRGLKTAPLCEKRKYFFGCNRI